VQLMCTICEMKTKCERNVQRWSVLNVSLWEIENVAQYHSDIYLACLVCWCLYRMARNFRGLKISRFSRINHEPRKFYPRKFYPSSFFLTTRTAHTQCVVLLVSTWPSVVLSILCSVVVSLWLSTDIFKLRRNLVASYPILVVLSRD